MKYFLKNWGHTKTNPSKSVSQLFYESEQNGGAFWREKCKVWFSDSGFGGRVEVGDVLIQYVPLGQPQEELAGRVLGYYEVESEFKRESLENQWFRYLEVKNLNKLFSEKSKNYPVLGIKAVIDKIPAAIQSGFAEISKEQAELIIKTC